MAEQKKKANLYSYLGTSFSEGGKFKDARLEGISGLGKFKKGGDVYSKNVDDLINQNRKIKSTLYGKETGFESEKGLLGGRNLFRESIIEKKNPFSRDKESEPDGKLKGLGKQKTEEKEEDGEKTRDALIAMRSRFRRIR
ncbi:MAG: hypothetical protein V1921_09040 [Candidatus Altiarchaeota archaeon]